MEHLPLPTNASKPILDVPFVFQTKYSLEAGPFHEFPVRYLETARNQDVHQTLLSLIQGWLFFGVICEFFGVEIDVYKFRRATKDGNYICTSHLRQLVRDDFIGQTRTAVKRGRNSPSKIGILIHALYALEQFEKSDIAIPGLLSILLSVRILLCSLAITAGAGAKRSLDLDHLLERLKLTSSKDELSSLSSFPFMDHMLANGWWYVLVQHSCLFV